MPLKPNSPSERFQELDALRGLCAAGVLCYHYLFWGPQFYFSKGEALSSFPWGSYRIQLFCMISGFVILMVLEKTKKSFDFVVHRFSRLYPSYFVVVILSACLVTIFSLPDRDISWPQVLINLTMFQPWLGVRNVDSAFWYLAPELSFYVCIFCVFLSGQLKRIEVFGFMWLVFMILNENVFGWGHLHLPRFIEVSHLLYWGHLFFAGILFYNLKTKGHSWQRHTGLALCFIVQNLLSYDIAPIISMGICLVLFYLFLFGRLSWIVQKPFLFLGNISYCLYLIHLNMGYIVIRYLYAKGINPWLRFLISTAIALAMATILTYGIERPMMNYIRGMYKKQIK